MNLKGLFLVCTVWSGIVAFGVASLVAPFGLGIIGPRVVRADMIIVESPNSPGKIILSTLAGGPTIFMYDGSGTARLDLNITPIGVPIMTMYHADGTGAVTIGALPSPSGPEISIRAAGGPAVWGARLKADGSLEVLAPAQGP